MIDIISAKKQFKEFLKNYNNQEDLGFDLKVVHTYHVAENAKMIAYNLNLSNEDILLAELIGLLHDIGRFEELKITHELNNIKFDHALYATKMLFDDGLIKKFIDDDKYDYIIKKAIENHNKLSIEDGLDEKTLLHCKIIRDADKLDNFRVKKEEKIEAIFPGRVNGINDMEESLISDKVYETILNKKCVDVHDRVYPLDYWICILAFTFDLNFKESLKIVKDNDYINTLIDRFDYKNEDSKIKMEEIRKIINNYINDRLGE